MTSLSTVRRPVAQALKVTLTVAAVIAIFATARIRIRCWGGGCICEPKLVDTYHHPDSRSGWLAENTRSGLLYSSIDDAMEFGVFDVADVMRGPLVRVPTEGYVNGVAIDDQANKLYAVQAFAGRVRVIDGATHDHHDIVVPDVTNALGQVVVDPRRHRLFVVRSDDLDVAVFETPSERFVGATGTGCCTTPSILMALDPTSGHVLILDQAENRLSAYDDVGSEVATMDVGAKTTGIAVDDSRRLAYLAQDTPQQLAVVDIDPMSQHAFTVIDRIVLRDRPGLIALDPVARVGYVSNNDAGSLSVIDLERGRWVMDVPVGRGPHHIAVDPTTARLHVSLSDQGVAIVQGCPLPARRPVDILGLVRRPTPTPGPRVVPTPADRSNPTEAAERRAYVRMERMFVNRTHCVQGPLTHEGARAMADIEASGAEVVDGGAAGQFCGVGPEVEQADLVAAGYFYSVPVIEPGAEAPTVWTFASATRTMLTTKAPTEMRVLRQVDAPPTPWRESLWWLSRCKTKVLGEECAR